MSHPVVAVSHAQEMIEEFLPHLRAAQQRGPAAWVTGVLAADSGLEQAVLVALAREGLAVEAARTRLREVLSDGADRAALCAASLEVEGCFAPLLGWELSWWTGEALPLAIDATDLREHEVVLSLSGLYRNSAIPVAWVALPHLGKGAWLPHLERLLGLLGPTVPAGMRVLVMTDRGLWSPTRWRAILTQGGPPVMRIRPDATFAPAGWRRQRAHASVSGPGCTDGCCAASRGGPCGCCRSGCPPWTPRSP